MKLPAISLNLFKAKNVSTVNENQQNPFIANLTNNPFAGGLKTDVFQNSTINNAQSTNIFAQKSAEFITNWNNGLEKIKNQAKEFFAPAISFAGNIKAGYEKLNQIKMENLISAFGKEISMLTLDREVRKYMKMPVAELRTELAKELI